MGVNIRTIKDIRSYLLKELAEIYGPPEINALADIIVRSVTGEDKLHQLYSPEKTVAAEQSERIVTICRELGTGKPIQYILGETVFYNCMIKVNGSVLIPRPETEELVDLVIRENRDYKGEIIDIGTGSGCIAIALARNLPGSVITGTDISDEALNLAMENAALNNVRISFIRNDLFNFDPGMMNRAGIIVSNPPYVRISEKALMQRNVLDFEPHIALFVSDSSPLEYYEAILRMAEKILHPGGMIYFEINEALGKEISGLLETSGYSGIKVYIDINGKDRFIKGRGKERK
jgi:release factor glutamine methyltransferase